MLLQFERDNIYFEVLREGQNQLGMKESHYHDFYEVYFYLGNYMEYFIDNQTHPVQKYDLVLIDKSVFHRTIYPKNSMIDRLLILYTPKTMAALGYEIEEQAKNLFKIKKPVFKCDNAKTALFSELNSFPKMCANAITTVGQEKFRLKLLEFLLTLIEVNETAGLSEDSLDNINPQEKMVADIISYINSNYTNMFSLDEIAGTFHLSKYYMCHVFKATTGLSIIEFINRKKMAEASALLKYSTKSVTDICYKMGFNNVSHFISLFKRQYGNTPKIYRNMFH